MKRIEIIGNRSIESDLFDIFKKNDIVNFFTKFPVVHGVGSSGPRHGDHIWPEENFLLLIFCDEKEAQKIIKAVKEAKSYFKDEGLKLYETDIACCV